MLYLHFLSGIIIIIIIIKFTKWSIVCIDKIFRKDTDYDIKMAVDVGMIDLFLKTDVVLAFDTRQKVIYVSQVVMPEVVMVAFVASHSYCLLLG